MRPQVSDVVVHHLNTAAANKSGGAEFVQGGADVDSVDLLAFVADELHSEFHGYSGGAELGGYVGAEAVEGFAVPGAAIAAEGLSGQADAVQANELGEFG